MLSALTDGRRLEKLFAGRKGAKLKGGGGQGSFVEKPVLPILRTSTVAPFFPALLHLAVIGSPACSPRTHLAHSCYVLSTFPLRFCFLPLSRSHYCAVACLAFLSPLALLHHFPHRVLTPTFSHSLSPSLHPLPTPHPPLTYCSDVPPLSVRKAKAGRQAGNEICFSPHSTPYRPSSPAPSSFTCCTTGPALY